jgi:hypothetical protein
MNVAGRAGLVNKQSETGRLWVEKQPAAVRVAKFSLGLCKRSLTMKSLSCISEHAPL